MSIKNWKYPGGEIGVRVDINAIPNNPTFRLHNSDDLMVLLLALNGYKTEGRPILSVTIPYMPYARQDRAIVHETKEAITVDPNSIEVLASLLATTSLKTIISYDVHSEKAIEAFDNVGIKLVSLNPYAVIASFIDELSLKNVYLISPDKGATDKTKHYLDSLGCSGLIQCSKVRDSVTGKLTGFEVVSEIAPIHPHAVFLIVDDICDGGRTFLGVHKAVTEVYGERASYLFVTHGIFSAGLENLLTKFIKIGCTNSFFNNLIHPNLITYPL